MSAPPARTSPSMRSRVSSGAWARESSGARITACASAPATARVYDRGIRFASTSHVAQLARSIAAQMPITGRGAIALEALEASELLPVRDRRLEGVELHAGPVEIVVHDVAAEGVAGHL